MSHVRVFDHNAGVNVENLKAALDVEELDDVVYGFLEFLADRRVVDIHECAELLAVALQARVDADNAEMARWAAGWVPK